MNDLDLYKTYKIKMIEQVSKSIIDEGYYCYVKDVVMPMDHESRSDYDMLAWRYSQMTNPPNPLYLRTVELGVYAEFLTAEELETFMQNAFEWCVAVRLSGTALIQQVLACISISEVDAIMDDRCWEDFKQTE